MSENETFYDNEIAPALAGLAKRCQDRGLSFLAVVEWEPGEHGRTLTLQAGSGLGIRMADAAAQAGNNADGLILALMKYAHEHGHSSMLLKQLGVPLTPEKSAA